MNCRVPVILAYAMTIYTLASLYYIVTTRNVGTPFYDTLSEEQIKVKNESSQVRKRIFYTGLVVSTIVMLVVKPFSKCLES